MQRRCSIMFFRCTNRHKLLFLAVLLAVIALNIVVLMHNKKGKQVVPAASSIERTLWPHFFHYYVLLTRMGRTR